MDGMQNWTTYLEAMRNRLLIVKDADSLISVLTDVKNIPIALSTIEDVTDLFRGQGSGQSDVSGKRRYVHNSAVKS